MCVQSTNAILNRLLSLGCACLFYFAAFAQNLSGLKESPERIANVIGEMELLELLESESAKRLAQISKFSPDL
jgi:hypothetical protein